MAGGNVSPQLGPLFAAAGAKYGIPANVLAGIASVETNLGGNITTSSTGAQGLMQFEPSTAKGLGVNPYNARSAIFGAAKLLVQAGYHQNPLRAIGAYNGGIGNPQYGYANQVMSEANRLKGQTARYSGTRVQGMPGQKVSKGGGASLTATPVSYRAVTTHGFDQAGFDQAQAASIAGNYISGQKDPYAAGQPRTGISSAAVNSPLFSSGALSTVAPNPADYQTAQTQLQKIAGQSVTVGAHPLASSAAAAHVAAGGQMNPFPHGYTPSRLDKGFDGTSHGPIASPVTGKVVFSSPSFSNWGGYVAVKADHPIPGLASDTFYFAEGLHPTVKLGQRVSAGQTIAMPVASRWNGIVGNLEWGLANPANPGDVFGKDQNTRSEVLALYNWARKSFGLGAATSTGTAGAF